MRAMKRLTAAATLTLLLGSNAAAQTPAPSPLHVTTCERGSGPVPDPGFLPELARTAPSGSVIVFDVDCRGRDYFSDPASMTVIDVRNTIVVDSRSLTIDATGHRVLMVMCSPPLCGQNQRMFKVGASGKLKLVNLYLGNGLGEAYASPTRLRSKRVPFITTVGGAIYVEAGGRLEIEGTIIARSFADEGGAIFNEGTTTIRDSEITLGGGTAGGAISNNGVLTVTNSTISNNGQYTGGNEIIGGGILNYGTATLANTTITANRANSGGGIFNEGTLTISGSTIADNHVDKRSEPSRPGGGGITNSGGTVTVSNTIISGNLTEYTTSFGSNLVGANCEGPITDNGNNLSYGDNSCAFLKNAATGDPHLGNAMRNGGPSPTLALGAGSAAIGGGNPNTCGAADQRGQPRNTASRNSCDIGAYDTGGAAVPTVTGVTISKGTFFYADEPASATITLAGPAPHGGATVAIVSNTAGLPTSVVIPEGKTSATIALDTRYISKLTYDSIAATYLGITKTVQFSVGVAMLADLAVSVAPFPVLTIKLDHMAPASGTKVRLTSSDPQIVEVDSLVTVWAAKTLDVRVLQKLPGAVVITAQAAQHTKSITWPPAPTAPASASASGGSKKVPVRRANRTPVSGPPPTPPKQGNSEERGSTVSVPPKPAASEPVDEPKNAPPAARTGAFRIALPTGVVRGGQVAFACQLAEGISALAIRFDGEGLHGMIMGPVPRVGPGTYEISDDGEIKIGFARLEPVAAYPASSGTVTITEWTRTVMRGSFRYTGETVDSEGVTHKHTVSGSFNAVPSC